MVISQNFLVYLGDELNRARTGNGTDAKSESFALSFVKILKLRVTHSIDEVVEALHNIIYLLVQWSKEGVAETLHNINAIKQDEMAAGLYIFILQVQWSKNDHAQNAPDHWDEYLNSV